LMFHMLYSFFYDIPRSLDFRYFLGQIFDIFRLLLGQMSLVLIN
jgi:hypothetical protein